MTRFKINWASSRRSQYECMLAFNLTCIIFPERLSELSFILISLEFLLEIRLKVYTKHARQHCNFVLKTQKPALARIRNCFPYEIAEIHLHIHVNQSFIPWRASNCNWKPAINFFHRKFHLVNIFRGFMKQLNSFNNGKVGDTKMFKLPARRNQLYAKDNFKHCFMLCLIPATF